MKKNRDSRLTYIVVFAVAGTLLIAGLYAFAGRQSFRYADDMRRGFRSNQEQLQKAEEMVRSLPNPTKALDDIESRHKEFRQVSGTGRQAPRIIQELGQSAAGRQINVISIKPKEEIKAGNQNIPAGVTRLFFEMIFTAPYQEIGEYARVLSTMPGSFTIETMTLHRQDDDAATGAERTGLINVNLIISTCLVGDI